VHSEPGGTANWLLAGASGLQTTARKVGDEWLLNGTKLWTTNSGGWDGKGADLQCVVARVVEEDEAEQDPKSDPRKNIIVLLVTRELVAQNAESAYKVLEEPELMGHRACSGPKSQFTNFKVPADIHVLAGPGGGGAAVIEQAFGCSSALVGVFATSIMRHTFEAALKFAKSEKRGGSKPIIEHQSVADILMDIKMRTDACRMMTWKALHAMENGPGDFNARLELCLEVKIFCSELAVRSVTDAMRAVGISSYAEDQPFAGWLNDAAVLPIFDGGNVGIRRRQIEKIYQLESYEPWAAI
jgi:alkylation response protein AidB-like acyl-CoA dehydrogenase